MENSSIGETYLVFPLMSGCAEKAQKESLFDISFFDASLFHAQMNICGDKRSIIAEGTITLYTVLKVDFA